MGVITIIPDRSDDHPARYRAMAGALSAFGKTPGEALDAISSELDQGTFIVLVDQRQPDHYLTAAQQHRLQELMVRWRSARDAGSTLPAEEQAELDALVAAELKEATARAQALADHLR